MVAVHSHTSCKPFFFFPRIDRKLEISSKNIDIVCEEGPKGKRDFTAARFPRLSCFSWSFWLGFTPPFQVLTWTTRCILHDYHLRLACLVAVRHGPGFNNTPRRPAWTATMQFLRFQVFSEMRAAYCIISYVSGFFTLVAEASPEFDITS